MKPIITITHITIAMIAAFSACSNVDTVDEITVNQENKLCLRTKGEAKIDNPSISISKKEKIVTKELVPVILASSLDRTVFKDVENYKIITVSREGRNLLHVVNFRDGGWAIVSGYFDEENNILAFGTEGTFEPSAVESPEVRFWLDMTEAMVEQKLVSDEKSTSKESLRSGPYDDEPFVWVRIPIGYVNSSSLVSNVDPLTVTEWDQFWPWNYKTPYVNGHKTPLGCFPVAAAQLIFYLHNTTGHPAGRFRQIDTCFTWNGSEGYYSSNVSRSDYSTNWYAMAGEDPGFRCSLTDHVGDFIIDVGDRFQAKYSYPLTSTSVYSYNNFSSFGLSCSIKDYNSNSDVNTVISDLEDDLPVIMNGWKNSYNIQQNKIGHAWLIDGYKKYHNISDYQQFLRIIPTDSLSFYSNLGYDAIFTDSEKESLYPGIEEYEIIHDPWHSYPVYFHMNWGFGGSYNDYFSSLPSTWNPNEDNAYQYGLKLMYNFSSIE